MVFISIKNTIELFPANFEQFYLDYLFLKFAMHAMLLFWLVFQDFLFIYWII